MPSLIFQLVAERTAADDPEPVATQFVLQLVAYPQKSPRP